MAVQRAWLFEIRRLARSRVLAPSILDSVTLERFLAEDVVPPSKQHIYIYTCIVKGQREVCIREKSLCICGSGAIS